MKTMLKTLAAAAAALFVLSGPVSDARAEADTVTACDEHKGEDKAGKADEKGKGCANGCKGQCKDCGKCGTPECKCEKGCSCGK